MENEIKEVFRKICEAFADSDIDKALSYFSVSEDMVKISNGHVLRGKEQLSAYWRENITPDTNLEISIDNIKINKIDGKHVWTIADEFISFGQQNYRAIVSNIFVLTPSGWKIVLDHKTSIVEDYINISP